MGIATPVAPFPADDVLPFASVVIACRNERRHIGPCLDSLLSSDYPQDRLELLVVDGQSDDGTRDIVRDYAARHRQVRLVDNPERITPAAFNAGIRAARGDVVAIVGSHASYETGYLRELVRHLVAYDADEAGAVATYVPRQDTPIGRALVATQTHVFGAGTRVGYKTGAARPEWVDTVSSGAYRKRVFDKIGLFNEQLVFSQDLDFNSRLRRAGGRILLVPSARIRYFARSDLGSFVRHQWRNGAWNLIPLAYTKDMLSPRHLVPMAFVGALAASALLALGVPGTWSPFALVAGSYLVANLAASVDVAVRARRPSFLMLMPPAFALLHLIYGMGSWWGAIELLRRRWAVRRA